MSILSHAREIPLPLPPSAQLILPLRLGNVILDSPTGLQATNNALLLMVSGSGSIEGVRPFSYTGDALLLVGGRQRLEFRPDTRTALSYLELANASGLFAHNLPAVSLEENELLRERAEGLMAQCAERRFPNVHAASAATYGLLMELLACSAREESDWSPLVQQAIAVIQQDFAFLEGIQELADQLGVTKNHLIRRFTAETGKSPGKHLQQVRLEHAKLLLSYRDYSIDMIANITGYSGADYFCKVFRRSAGESPGSYRSRNRSPVPPGLDQEKRIRELENMMHI